MAFRVTGRVLSVRPRADGSFGVMVGPGPNVYFYVTNEPPRLGDDLTLVADDVVNTTVDWHGRKGNMGVLRGAQQQLVSPKYATRVVAPEWVSRVKASMRRPLYRYQAEGAGWMAAQLAASKGAMLADEAGLGKSSQTVAAICATRLFPCILVCPASLKVNWKREFMFAWQPPTIEIVEGRKGELRGADVVIINYDLLSFRETQLNLVHARSIVFDEAQEIKEPRPRASHRAAVATRLVAGIGKALLLTGTPIMNRPAELWRLLHLVDSHGWPSFDEFMWRYCREPAEARPGVKAQRRIVTNYGKAERLDELQARMAPVFLRRRKTEVLTDLPPKSRKTQLVSIDFHDMQQYRAAERDVVAWLKETASSEKARAAAAAKAIVKLTMLRRIAAVGKMRHAVPQYIQHWFDRPQIEPLVIFAYHRQVLDQLFQLTKHLGLRVVGLGGHENAEGRQRVVDAFQEGKADVFIAPIKTAVGITLTRSNESLFVERTWTPSQMTQAEDRQYRIGQLRPVTATYIDAAGTVDEHIAAVLEAKQMLISSVVDGAEASDDTFLTVKEVVDRFMASAGERAEADVSVEPPPEREPAGEEQA